MTLVDLQDNLGLLEALVSELRRDPFDSTKRECVLEAMATVREDMDAIGKALTDEPDEPPTCGPDGQPPLRRMTYARGGQSWREVVR